jgi:hypothetical protein
MNDFDIRRKYFFRQLSSQIDLFYLIMQAVKPWKHATVSMFTEEAVSAELPVGQVSPATETPPPPAKEAGALMVQKHQDAAEDGAGTSRPAGTLLNYSLSGKFQRKIIGIRAALQFNGYPPNVIERLLREKIKMWAGGWYIYLPNGNRVEIYQQIDANPYPGGTIVKKEDRKCPFPGCTREFSHHGGCIEGNPDAGRNRLNYDTTIVQVPNPAPNQPPTAATAATGLEDREDGGAGPSQNPRVRVRLSAKASIVRHKFKTIRDALIAAGYSEQMAAKRINSKRTFQGSFRPGSQMYDWSLLLPGGVLVRSISEISRTPKTPEIDEDDVIFSDEENNDDGDESNRARCFLTEHCIRVQDHVGECAVHPKYRKKGYKRKKTFVEIAEEEEGEEPANGFDDGGGLSKPAAAKPEQKVDMQELELKLNHAAVGVHAALGYAGYPPQLIEQFMGKHHFRMKAHLEWKGPRKFGWSIKLPHTSRISSYVGILANPCPGGTVAANPVCHTLGCDKQIGHFGRCRVPRSDRHKVKPGLGEGMPLASYLRNSSAVLLPSSSPRANFQSMLSSSSDEGEEDGAISLPPTEDERNSDEEGEDPYSSLDED